MFTENPYSPYGVSMTLRESDPFFGMVGNLIAQYLGLAQTGRNGQLTPIFRSNIFDHRDPSMTGQDYALSDIYARRAAATIGGFQRQMAKSVDSMFNENSFLGSKVYERDRNGNFVQNPGTIAAFDMIRSLATSSQGSGIMNSLLNSFLGYDRGAGSDIFSQNIDSILARDPSYRVTDTDLRTGQRIYGRLGNMDPTDDRYQQTRAIASTMLNQSLQQVMYGDDGITKDWDTSHGISETLAARIVSDAARSGAYFRKYAATERDRKLHDKASSYENEANGLDKELEKVKKAAEAFKDINDETGIADTERQIKEITTRQANLRKEARNLRNQTASFDYDGDFNALVERARANDDKAAEIYKELGSAESGKGLYARQADLIKQSQGKYENFSSNWDNMTEGEKDKLARSLDPIEQDLARTAIEIDNANKKLEEINKDNEDLARKMNNVTQSIVKNVSKAVDTARVMFGGEQESYDALYKMTGGEISRKKGVALSVDSKMKEYLNTGIVAGLSNDAMRQIFGTAVGAVASARDVPAAWQNTFESTALGLNAATVSARAMMIPGLSDAERESLSDAAVWFNSEKNRNTAGEAIRLAQWAYENQDMTGVTEGEYKSIMSGLVSGKDEARGEAFKKLVSKVFNGNMEEAAEFLTNPAKMALIGNWVEDKDEVVKRINEEARNETTLGMSNTRLRTKRDKAASRASLMGADYKMVQAIEDEAGIMSIGEELQRMAEDGNEDAKRMSSTLQNLMAGWQKEKEKEFDRAGKPIDRDAVNRYVNRKAAEWMDSTGFDIMGGEGETLRQAALRGAAFELENRFGDMIVANEANAELKAIIGENDNAYVDKESGTMTTGNLMKVADVVFGKKASSMITDPDKKKRYNEVAAAARKAKSEGDFNEVMNLTNQVSKEFFDDNTRGWLAKEIGRTVSFDDKRDSTIVANEANAELKAIDKNSDLYKEMSKEEAERADKTVERAKELIRKNDFEGAKKIMDEYYDSLSDDKKKIVVDATKKGLQSSTVYNNPRSIEAIQTADRFLREHGENAGVTELVGMLHSEELTAESDPVAQAYYEKRMDDLKKQAYDSSKPGAESIVDFLAGRGSFVNIFKNGNMPTITADNVFNDKTKELLSPEQQKVFDEKKKEWMAINDNTPNSYEASKKMREFAENYANEIQNAPFNKVMGDLAQSFGFAPDDGTAALYDLFTAGGARNASTEEIMSSLVKAAERGTDEDLKNLGEAFSMQEETMWGYDKGNFADDMKKLASSSKKDREKGMGEVLTRLKNRTRDTIDDLEDKLDDSDTSTEDKEKIKSQLEGLYKNLSVFNDAEEKLKKGTLDLGGIGLSKVGGPTGEQGIPELIAKIDALIGALEAHTLRSR